MGGGAARLEVVLLACPQLLREVARPTRPARLDMLHAYLPHVRLRARAGGLTSRAGAGGGGGGEEEDAERESIRRDKIIAL